MDLEKISRAFKRNRFACSVFSCKEDAASYLVRSISGKTVGIGDSVTLASMGLYEKLQKNNDVWDVAHLEGIGESDFSSPARNKKFLEAARKCLTTDIFLTSVNAASETGMLVNIDGTGNRIAGSLFGHEKVYFVFGVNKIVPSLEDAVARARNVAAPKNVERHRYKCGCSARGGDRCYDCGAPDRICNALTVYYKKMRNTEMEVVIINENLGY